MRTKSPLTGEKLDERRRELRMTIPQLARRTGVSTATVARVLRSESTVAIGHVQAVAEALGMTVELRTQASARSLVRRAARAKAVRAVSLVQATSALEGQGLSKAQLDAMIDRTCDELHATGGKTLWAE
jgi:transcriptional regulator with XRE-family HTH domain